MSRRLRTVPGPDLDDLRRYAAARTLFRPTTLPRAIERLGFVQADPIRAPARAQDLILRHRVAGYRAGDLERRYPGLAVEEDFFVNYGFVPRALHALMHPRTARTAWSKARWVQAQEVQTFVRERGVVHPREVVDAFAHGKARNWFGGSANASTQLLDGMHYRGLLRVARRELGVRLYAAYDAQARASADPDAGIDALVDYAVELYAPLPAPTLSMLVMWLGTVAAAQWRQRRAAALARAKARLSSAAIDGVQWFWPGDENPASRRYVVADRVRLLTPFDPLVWDRRRFEAFWGWAYRFEAYVPAPKRRLGYYALPLLWRDRVIGWGNLALRGDRLEASIGFASGRAPRDAGFRSALDAELSQMQEFLVPRSTRRPQVSARAVNRQCTTSAKPRPRSDGVT